MADPAGSIRTMTIAEFDRFVAAQQDDRGVGAGRRGARHDEQPHGEFTKQIAGNIGAPLKLAMDAAGCRSYRGGNARAALGGRRGQGQAQAGRRRAMRPEAEPDVRLPTRSSSSRFSRPRRWIRDRGPKLAFYKSLATLRHIALVYQDQMRVEHYHRSDLGWELEVLTSPDEVLKVRRGGLRARSRSGLFRRRRPASGRGARRRAVAPHALTPTARRARCRSSPPR